VPKGRQRENFEMIPGSIKARRFLRSLPHDIGIPLAKSAGAVLSILPAGKIGSKAASVLIRALRARKLASRKPKSRLAKTINHGDRILRSDLDPQEGK